MPNLQSFSLSNVSEHYFLLENEIYLWLVLTRNSSDQWSHKNYLHFHLQDPCEAARTDSWAPVDQTKVAPIPFCLVFHFKITIRNEKRNQSTQAHVSLIEKKEIVCRDVEGWQRTKIRSQTNRHCEVRKPLSLLDPSSWGSTKPRSRNRNRKRLGLCPRVLKIFQRNKRVKNFSTIREIDRYTRIASSWI